MGKILTLFHVWDYLYLENKFLWTKTLGVDVKENVRP